MQDCRTRGFLAGRALWGLGGAWGGGNILQTTGLQIAEYRTADCRTAVYRTGDYMGSNYRTADYTKLNTEYRIQLKM